MSRRLRNLWVLLLAMPLAGCANPRIWRDATPQPKPKKVTIDAEWSSENPSEELRRAMLERKQASSPGNDSANASPPTPLRADSSAAEPARPSPNVADWSADRNAFQRDPPPQAIPVASDIAFAVSGNALQATAAVEQQPIPPSRSAGVAPATAVVRPPATPQKVAANEPLGVNRQAKARDPPPEIASSEIRPPPTPASPLLRLSGVIEDGEGEAMAMLEIKGQGTAYARAGDSLDVVVDGRPITVRVGKVAVHAVSVQFGSDPNILVLR